MNLTNLHKSSIKIKATLTMLLVFVFSLWSLSFYTSHILREDMERLQGEQQRSMVAFVASEFNDQLSERLSALESMVAKLDLATLGSAQNLQAFLEQSPILEVLFNGGGFITGADGIALASTPNALGRNGVNYSHRDFIVAALNGKASIGTPFIGERSNSPLVVMAVPIRDAQGKVIAALAGVTDLGRPNFLGKLSNTHYGRTGGYLLQDTKNRLVITGTDKRRIMQLLPAPGVNPLIDRHIAGHEVTGVTVNPMGVEVLASAKRIAVTNWMVVVSLPTEEAFAPINDIQSRLILATLALTLLTGGLTWWMLRRQLAPLLSTTKMLTTLSTFAGNDQPLQALPITRYDEIGALVGGFNHLLDMLAQRKAATERALNLLQKIASRVPGLVFEFRLRPDGSSCVPYASDAIHAIYRVSPKEVKYDASPVFAVVHPDDLAQHLASIQTSAKNLSLWNHEYRLKFADEPDIWLLGNAIPEQEANGDVLWHGFITDITERKKAEAEVKELNRDFVAFLENTTDFIYFKDENSRFRFCSQTLADITGHASWRDMIGKHDLEVFPKETAQIYYEEELPIFRDAQPLLNKVDPYYDAAGQQGWVSTNKWPLLNSDAAVVGLFGISRDITEFKQITQALQQSESRFRQMFERNDLSMLLIKTSSGEILDANAAAVQFYGYSLEQLKSMKIDQINKLSPQAIAQDMLQARDKHRNAFIFPHQLASGEVRTVEVRSSRIDVQEDEVLFSIVTDISERIKAQDKLRLAASVFTHAREGIMITDPDSTIIDVNAAFTRITGYSRAEVLGRRPYALSTWRQGKQFYASLQRELNEKGHWFGEVWDRRKSGEVYAEMLTISAVRDAQGKTMQYVILFSDITDRKEREDKMRQIAFYDPLTELPNRRLFIDRLGQAIAAGKRSGHYSALMFLDLDNFKPLNDLHGHAVGDLLLVSVARRLIDSVREMDTVSRFGGDEFVVLLSELNADKASSTEEALGVAEKIRASLAAPYALTVTQTDQTDATLEHHCSASIGVTVFLGNEISQEALFVRADTAMYLAKEAGRNVIRLG